MHRLRVLRILLLPILLAGGVAGVMSQEVLELVAPGSKVPALKVEVLQPGASTVTPFDLGSVLGKRPVIFAYFRLGESVGEEVFLDVQAAVASAKQGKVALFGVLLLTRKSSLQEAADRLSLFGVDVPIIIEKGFELGRVLGVTTSPSINLIDSRGILRITDGKGLKQRVSDGMKLADAIRKLAQDGPVPTVMKLRRYYPAQELVGESFPDFILKRFGSDERIKLSDRVGAAKKVTAVFFWHPDCKHCKRALPGILTGSRSYKQWLDVISVVNLKNANETRNCTDAVKALKIDIPVLEDEGRRINDLYKVISTPTMFFVRPDGIIDSVYTSGDINYVPVFSSRIRSILRVGREYEKKGR